MGDELVPQSEQAGHIDRRECHTCVVFCCLVGMLGGVDTMVVLLNELDLGFYFLTEYLIMREHSLSKTRRLGCKLQSL